MQFQHLQEAVNQRRSLLCVGIDPDFSSPDLKGRPLGDVVDFARQIIEATSPYCVAYKINTAFFEAFGTKGWQALENVFALLPESHFRIADAKRGDIGNTSRQYARCFFEAMDWDAVTVNPYMGHDSVAPFLEYRDKATVLLALTSNPGAEDFQFLGGTQPVYLEVVKKSQKWSASGQLMYVTGATRPEHIANIREVAPEAFLLVPGVGAQGGDLEATLQAGCPKQNNCLINVSRGLLAGDAGQPLAERVKFNASRYQQQIAGIIL